MIDSSFGAIFHFSLRLQTGEGVTRWNRFFSWRFLCRTSLLVELVQDLSCLNHKPTHFIINWFLPPHGQKVRLGAGYFWFGSLSISFIHPLHLDRISSNWRSLSTFKKYSEISDKCAVSVFSASHLKVLHIYSLFNHLIAVSCYRQLCLSQ